MKKITDEILNKYMDNELSRSEVNELKKYIADNPSEIENLKALQLVNDVLYKMEYDSAPVNFTEKVMWSLNNVVNIKHRKNYFIRFVFSFFALTGIGLIISLLTFPAGEAEVQGGKGFLTSYLDKFNFNMPSLGNILSSDAVLVSGSTLILILLLTVYIVINSQKSLKNKIEQLTH